MAASARPSSSVVPVASDAAASFVAEALRKKAAAVAVEGGSLGGQTIAAGLQKEGEDWKVDSFFAFIKYDPASLAEGLEEALGEQEGVSPEVAACVGEGVEEMTEEEAELLVFEKENEGFEEIFAACNG